MFSQLDDIIFPDSCEVIQVASQQFVYPIFKNGRSSLINSIDEKDWRIVDINCISSISSPITVFLRDPQDRFISGVNTYVQHVIKTNPNLDFQTILFFVNQYCFLNRHFCPQFFWLINLARHTAPEVLFNFCNYKEISKLTHRKNLPEGVDPVSQEMLDNINKFNWDKLELYFFLDQILINSIGQQLSFNQIMTNVRTNYPDLYRLVFGKSHDLINVLSKN
jgi:hypothetical protein